MADNDDDLKKITICNKLIDAKKMIYITGKSNFLKKHFIGYLMQEVHLVLT